MFVLDYFTVFYVFYLFLFTFPFLEKISSCVLVAWGGYNKVPITKQLKTTESYSFTVLNTRSPKPRCQQGWLLLRVWRRDLFHSYFLPLGTAGNCWLVNALLLSLHPPSHDILSVSLCLHMLASLCFPPFLMRTTFILDKGHTSFCMILS